MEKVKYSIAIQTYMEVFDFLITHDLFIFDSGKDFLKSKIKIGKYGFIKETQIKRDIWDEENDKFELVPAIYVLNILTTGIDKVLSTNKIPVSPSSNYAYIKDLTSKKNYYPSHNSIFDLLKEIYFKKNYYPSYKYLLDLLKEIKNDYEQFEDSDKKIINFNLAKFKDLSSVFLKLTPLEKRIIECYAKLEQDLIDYTYHLLMIDENGYPVEGFRKDLYFRGSPDYQLRYASTDTYVDWKEFKDNITENYQYQLDENRFDMRGVYSPFDSNPYKSPLGLDGKTK